MEHIDYTYTRGMTDEEIENQLMGDTPGVLALASENDAYAIPIVHYYDGDRLYFRIGLTDSSHKRRFLDDTATARYLLFGSEQTDAPRAFDSWSVIVSGALRQLPPDERAAFDTVEINRRFAPIRVFNEAIPDIEIAIVELVISSVTGRCTLNA